MLFIKRADISYVYMMFDRELVRRILVSSVTSSHFLYCAPIMSLRLPHIVSPVCCSVPAGLTPEFHSVDERELNIIKSGTCYCQCKVCLALNVEFLSSSPAEMWTASASKDFLISCRERGSAHIWKQALADVFFFFFFLQTTTTSSSLCSTHMSSHSVHYNPDELTTSLEHFTR